MNKLREDGRHLKKISIIGLGHIGYPLAKKLNNDFEVIGTVSSDKKNITDIKTVIFRTDAPIPSALEASITVLTVPPSGLNLNELPKIKTDWLIYTSSTSVYGTYQGVVTEETACNPDDESGKKILEIEKWVQSYPNWTILRLGGLVGPNRHPGKYLAGRLDIFHPQAPVNLVHHDDVVEGIIQVIKQEKKKMIFNLVCDEHHTRKEFYQEFARRMELPLPEFREEKSDQYKLVLNDKIKQHLGIKFIFSELIGKDF